MIHINKRNPAADILATYIGREPLMAYYRLYHIKGAHFAGFDEIEAVNDAQAIVAAERLTGAGTAELWCGGHKIKRIAAKPAAAA